VTKLRTGQARNSGSTAGTDRRWTCKVSTSTLGPILPPIQWLPEFLSPRIKRPGREAHHISPPTDDSVVTLELLLLRQRRSNLSQASPFPLVYKNCLQLHIRNFHLYLRRYFPDGAIGIFHWHNPSGRTMALGLTQSLTEMSKQKCKSITLQAWTGPEGSRRLRLPNFKIIGKRRWQGSQSYAPAAFTPKEYSWYSFLLGP
jgi:hypothetical protein